VFLEGSSKDVAADEGDAMVQLLESHELESMMDRRSASKWSTAAPDVVAIIVDSIVDIGEQLE
jgi:hypothetical protein